MHHGGDVAVRVRGEERSGAANTLISEEERD